MDQMTTSARRVERDGHDDQSPAAGVDWELRHLHTVLEALRLDVARQHECLEGLRSRGPGVRV